MDTALRFLAQLDWHGFLYLFWFYIIFDVPRYTLSLLTLLFVAPFQRSYNRDDHGAPVSILLVGFNERASLYKTVRSLHEQTHPRLELILVDDGSTDGMASLGASLRDRGWLDRVVSTGIRGGKSSAINLGLQYSSHDIISVVDIDTTFDRDAFARLIQPLSDPEVGAVAGNLGVRNDTATIMTRLQAIEYLMSISLGRRFAAMMGILSIVSGAFGAFRRSAIDSVGGWDVGPGEDADITEKLRLAGWRIEFVPHAWSLTDVPTHLMGFTRQRLRWNRSVIRFRMRKYRRTFNPRHANFRFLNVLAMSNILFFQVLLAITFYAYLSWLFWSLGHLAFIIIAAIAVIYIAESVLAYGVACLMYADRAPLRFGPYVPAQALFATFIQRAVRMTAYFDELIFRRSYTDPYVPEKVRRRALRH